LVPQHGRPHQEIDLSGGIMTRERKIYIYSSGHMT